MIKPSQPIPRKSYDDRTSNVKINSLLDINIQSEVPHIQSSSVLKVLVSVISDPSLLTLVQESPSVAPVTSLPPLSVSTIPPVPHQTTTPIPTPPITTDTPTITTVVPESDALTAVQLRIAKLEKVPTVVDYYLGSKLGDALQKALQKLYSASKILKIKKKQAEKQKMPKYTIKSTDKAALKEYDQKALSTRPCTQTNPPTRPDQGKKIKRRRTKESESLKKQSTAKETPKGKAPSKGSKTGKSATTEEPVREPIAEAEMNDVVNTTAEDVGFDVDQPHDDSTQAKDKDPKQDWFKQPPRPPTPDPEWNKR
ncbi:hypothetical protein Tco_0156452 [Tanacetum coccineum]